MRTRSSLFMGLTVIFMATATCVTACGSSEADSADESQADGGKKKKTPWEDEEEDEKDAATAESPSEDSGIPSLTEFCSNGELELPGSTKGKRTCAGDLPSKYFRFAACSCTNIALSGSVRTSSMNSSAGTTNAQGASIGANGSISFTGSGTVGGSAYAAGHEAGVSTVTYTGTMRVDHDLWSIGNVAVGAYGAPPSVVAGDAYVHGSILPAGSLVVKGKTTDPGTFDDPCDCTRKLDIPGVVSKYKNNNDNAAIGLKKDALENGGALTLPCGRYYLSSIGNSATLNVQGTVALFIEKDINVHGGVKINLAKDATIDVFIGGSFVLTGTADLGSLSAPARVRLYIAKDLGLTGTANIGGNIYAPNTTIGLTSQFRMAGSIFANDMAFTGGFDITYDDDVLGRRGQCAKPGDECKSCGDCAGSAPSCNNGYCGACETNADCCAPQVCSNGSCIQDIR